jgi:hypothetical protein
MLLRLHCSLCPARQPLMMLWQTQDTQQQPVSQPASQ